MLLVPRQTLRVLKFTALFAKRSRTAGLCRDVLPTSTCLRAKEFKRLELPIELAAPAEATTQGEILCAQVGQKAAAMVLHCLCQNEGIFFPAEKV
eukprot:Skav234411  [mRNA]  locus=scaffold3157:6834:7118:+ [translate_table: standard]